MVRTGEQARVVEAEWVVLEVVVIMVEVVEGMMVEEVVQMVEALADCGVLDLHNLLLAVSGS